MGKKRQFFVMLFILAAVLMPKIYAEAVLPENVEKIYLEFLRQPEEDMWNGYEENSYAIVDLNGDGRAEMLRKGKEKNTDGEKIAVYCYDELHGEVEQTGILENATDNCMFFYSPGRRCLVLCNVYNLCSEYKFYSLADGSITEKFCVSYTIEEEMVKFYYTEYLKQVLLSEIPYEDWSSGKWDTEIWEKYTSDLQRIEFQSIIGERYVRISVDGEEYGIYPIWIDQKIGIGETNICKIESGMCRMTEADCPKQICVSQGKIKNEGEMIVCLPNKVVIEIISSNTEKSDKNQIDAFSY